MRMWMLKKQKKIIIKLLQWQHYKKSTPEILYENVLMVVVSLNLCVTQFIAAILKATPGSQGIGGCDGNFGGIIKNEKNLNQQR